MATTQVILTEKIETLGAEADVVKVRAGYARNFLIPTGKALEVTPVTMRRINLLKAKRAEREARELNEAQDLAKKFGDAVSAKFVWRTDIAIPIEGDAAETLMKLLTQLDDLDDVQDVYSNEDISDEEMARLSA